ncbi:MULTISPECIES: hypothetical protein [Sediminispirochaeta]|jgi:hypothetical protein|uniref:Uncharacterized protein n=1 Tax=Sediminispirochaeta smaragdinae (strain DSM 11293 / JCM 15392 / SEBR 4228) TaxID=573413 RepID=E1R6I9_SEDSS|nr:MULTISPECIES: hypothetical protein [Sediminispirochaeta]ADK81007.1 hypothetical protein Spirs_1881 [Sediminispirochaeta smaragdinae DSM 11293]
MSRKQRKIDPRKIEELKRKINDQRYINGAIESLALVITKELLHLNGE